MSRPQDFTPGPWEAIGTAVHADNGREIIFGQHNTRSGTPDERKANARLIAQAPALVAALEEALPIMEGMRQTTSDSVYAATIGARIEEARAVLAAVAAPKGVEK